MPSNITCPSCGHAFDVVATATVPDSQRIRLKMSAEGPYFAADSVAKVILAQVKILKAVAREMGAKVAVFVSGMVFQEQEIEIEFTILKQKKEAPADAAE